jgi:ABC-type bacteriocin/lantibiotic exporter with double-glycine peptidase domain
MILNIIQIKVKKLYIMIIIIIFTYIIIIIKMNIIINLLLDFFKTERFSTIIIIILSLFINLLQANGISYVTSTIISTIQKYDINETVKYFKYFILLSIIIIASKSIFKYLQSYLSTKLKPWISYNLIKILMKINKQDMSEVNFTKLFLPISRISSIPVYMFNSIIKYVLPTITFIIMISMYFLYKNLHIGMIFIIGNILIMSYCINTVEDIYKKNRDYEKHINEHDSKILEILNNFDKIIYRAQTDQELEKILSSSKDNIKIGLEYYNSTYNNETIVTILLNVLIIIIIGYLIYLYSQKKLDLVTFITFFSLSLLYRDKILILLAHIPDFTEYFSRANYILDEFVKMKINYEDIKNINYKKINLEFNRIEFKDVNFKYNSSNKDLFKDFNMNLDINNKIIGITGLSGNGKTTFVKLFLGLYKCTDGDILIDGIPINKIDPDYIRLNITYVNQNSKLFDKKIMENILYACQDMSKCNIYLQEIMKYEKIRNLYKNIDLNKFAGSNGDSLSGGQRQITNIINGLINPSKILILDEPTNALDPELKKELLQIIKDFKKYKKCIIIITHDKDTYGLFDKNIKI